MSTSGGSAAGSGGELYGGLWKTRQSQVTGIVALGTGVFVASNYEMLREVVFFRDDVCVPWMLTWSFLGPDGWR
jgi:hypothetical protein